jgi:hypothetical protein
MMTFFQGRGGTLDQSWLYLEVQAALDAWAAARSARATGYVGSALKLNTIGMTPEQIQACLEKLAPLKMHPRDRQEYRHQLRLFV